MPTYGPSAPGSGFNTVSGGNAWTTPGNILVNDASYAVVTLIDFGCFLANTKIYYTDGSFRAIQNIKIGEIISDAYGNDVEVLNLHKMTVQEYMIVGATCGFVEVTDYHPFLMEDGTFKRIGDVKVGEYVRGHKILSKTRIAKEVDVYNLSVSGSETYIANNFKVHNK